MPKEECLVYKEQESKLEVLKFLSPEWSQLVSSLNDLKCNGENNWVCCEKGWI